MPIAKDKKGALIRYTDEILRYHHFLINDVRFFKYAYLFRYIFSRLRREKKLASINNILTYLRERIGDPEHQAYKQAYYQFYFIPRYLYDTNTYYGLNFDEILKACRTTLILLVHDLPDEAVERVHTTLQQQVENILNRESVPYVYQFMERNHQETPQKIVEHVHEFQEKLIENAFGLTRAGAGIADLRYIYTRIGVSSTLLAYIIEKLQLMTSLPEETSFEPPQEMIKRTREKNKRAIKESFRQHAKDYTWDEVFDLYVRMGWSSQFINTTLKEE